MSMEGIEVDEEVATIYNDMKLNGAIRWAIFKIQNKRLVVLDTKATGGQGFTEFYASLKKSGEPRYALYDVPQEWGVRVDKIIFLFWCPDSFRFSQKMIYGSTKDMVKNVFSGLSAEIQVEKDDPEYVKNELLTAAIRVA